MNWWESAGGSTVRELALVQRVEEALVAVVEALSYALEAHRPPDVTHYDGCPVCVEWQPRINAAHEQVQAALSEQLLAIEGALDEAAL